MKTILVPTDFSRIARNAAVYAAEFAMRSKSKLILMNVYHVPVVSSEVPIVLPVWENVEENALIALNRVKRSLIRKFGKELQVECICQMGFGVDEIIKQFTEDKNIELIIMGMNGSGYLGEKIMGSNVTELIKRSNCPVLVINHKTKFNPIKKIVLAFDYKKVPNASVFDLLKKITKLFKSQLLIVNVVDELKKLPSIKKAVNGVNIDHLLEGINHSFHSVENDDTIEGVNEFVSDTKAEMLVFIPHKHGFLSSIFHESNTKRMAFHSTIPMLALHD